jgi:signal transduction histidine kinase
MTDDPDRSDSHSDRVRSSLGVVRSRFRTGVGYVDAMVRRLLPGFIRRNYLLKFGLALMIIVLLITVVGIVAINQTTETLDEQVSDQLQTETEREVEEIRTWREQRSRWLNEISKTRAMQNDQTDPIGIYLQQEVQQNVPDDVRFVHFINRTTTEVLASDLRRVEETVLQESGTPWATKQLTFQTANDVFVSEVYRNEGIPSIAFVTPVPERPNFALVAISRAQHPITRLEEQRQDRFITAVDSNGTIVMDSRGHQFVGQEYSGERAGDVISRGQAGESAFLRKAPNQEQLDRDYVAAFAPLEEPQGENNWVVITHAPEEEVYLVRTNIIRNLIVMLLISLIGLAVIGVVIAGGTVRSIDRLARNVEELEEGNLDVELSTRREDEIGQLYDGFDSMRQTLQNRIEELSEAMETEEQMRKELAETNRDLKDQRVIISVLNRLLRHNLRNSMTSILLRIEQLSDEVPEEQMEEIERLFQVTERLMRRVEKSKAIEKIIETEPEKLATVDVTEIVGETVEIHREEFSEAEISTTLPETVYVRGGEGVSFVVDNLLENALEHNDQDEPRAWVTVQTVTEDGQQWVELLVEDDGPGIPQMEIEVLEKEEETPLQHGSGIGLWLINWLVDHMKGELYFEDRDPRGSRIRVRFPVVDEATAEVSTASSTA